jgi:molybdopterin-guanine dinucleotide biosynthesis protein
MTSVEFNEKYVDYLEEGHYGLDINIESVIEYLDAIFTDLVKIEGFKFQQIKTKFGLARVYTNLDEKLPLVGRIIHQEIEEKINFILKVEYEIDRRMNKDGKSQ